MKTLRKPGRSSTVMKLASATVVLSHEGKHSRSGETRIIKKINQVNEHIKIPYDDKIADVSVAMQRQEPLDADLLKDLRFGGNDSAFSGQKVQLLDPGIYMSLVSTVLAVDRMYTTQMMTGCKPTLSLFDGHALCG